MALASARGGPQLQPLIHFAGGWISNNLSIAQQLQSNQPESDKRRNIGQDLSPHTTDALLVRQRSPLPIAGAHEAIVV